MKRENKLKTKIGYGAGDMYAGGAFLLIGLLFLNYLTDIVGLSGTVASLVFLIGKLWDAISDPLMGYISDHTKHRMGRRRLYFALGIIPIFLSFSLLWFNINAPDFVQAIYYTFAYIFFTTTFTMVMVPYNGLLPNMITDYKQRTSFNMYRMIFSSFSAILSGVLPMLIINNASSPEQGYMLMGLLFGVIYAVPWIFVLKSTWENPIEIKKDNHSNPFIIIYKQLKSAFSNRSFRQHASFYISSQTAADFLITLFIYYLTYVLFREGEFSFVLGTLLVVQLLSMPFHNYISQKYNKRTPFILGLSIWSIGLILTLFVSKDSPSFLIYVVAGLSGIGGSAAIFVPWSILPEISDVDEIITGERREGIYAGMSTLLRKTAQAISVALIGVYLDIIHYVPNTVQTDFARNGIKYIFMFGPLLFIVLAIIFVLRYPMTEEKHSILMNEIVSRKINKIVSTDSKVISICEELTGLKYDSLATDTLFNKSS